MTEATLQAALIRFMPSSATVDGHRQHVCGHLCACRTEAMGGMHLACDGCGTEACWYYGCRDRHCPQCQGRASQRWAGQQAAHILPVPYFHLVFTLPHTLNGWITLHPEVIYRLLFSATWYTVQRFADRTKKLGGQAGMTAVLHTWGQTLTQHVHLHCLIPGGVLTPAGDWRGVQGTYLFPVRALSRHFRGRMVSLLSQALEDGELHRLKPGSKQHLTTVMQQDWVVYSKPCLTHTQSVVDYLARYSHRIAITAGRILAVTEGDVCFRYRDYPAQGQQKIMTLRGGEFVRRFLQHVLPAGLMRIRHFGFLANCVRRKKLARIRDAMTIPEPSPEEAPDTGDAPLSWPCPDCRQGRLHIRHRFDARPWLWSGLWCRPP